LIDSLYHSYLSKHFPLALFTLPCTFPVRPEQCIVGQAESGWGWENSELEH